MFRLSAILLMFTLPILSLQCGGVAAGTSDQHAMLASKLFNINLIRIDDSNLGANYGYNNWKDSPGMHKQGKLHAPGLSP